MEIDLDVVLSHPSAADMLQFIEMLFGKIGSFNVKIVSFRPNLVTSKKQSSQLQEHELLNFSAGCFGITVAQAKNRMSFQKPHGLSTLDTVALEDLQQICLFLYMTNL